MTEIAKTAADWVDTSKLQPWARNPRRNDAAVKRVADSIRRFGFAAPILARRENNEIIAGHTRWRAAKLLGIGKVPVRFMDISESDAHLLALADNKTGELAEWDDAAVAKILGEYNFADAIVAGWTGAELGKMVDDLIGAPDQDDDASESLGAGLTYSIIIECQDETQQGELLERFESEGLQCKPMVT